MGEGVGGEGGEGGEEGELDVVEVGWMEGVLGYISGFSILLHFNSIHSVLDNRSIITTGHRSVFHLSMFARLVIYCSLRDGLDSYMCISTFRAAFIQPCEL